MKTAEVLVRFFVGIPLLIFVIVMVILMITEEIGKYQDRRWSRRRSIESEWRIHQIRSNARSQMWDEVTRHREDGGG